MNFTKSHYTFKVIELKTGLFNVTITYHDSGEQTPGFSFNALPIRLLTLIAEYHPSAINFYSFVK